MIYNIVIIGCGIIAGSKNSEYSFSHMDYYSKNKNFKVIACIDKNKKRLNIFKKKWKIKNSYSSIKAITKSNLKIDIVDVCDMRECVFYPWYCVIFPVSLD